MRPLSLLTLAVLLAACGGPVREETVIETWPSGDPKEVRVTEEGVAEVDVQQFHENGRIHVRGQLIEDVREGTWNTYRENGNPWSQVDYQHGVKEGLFRTWHPNGLPHIEGQHSAGQPAGEWTFFSTQGQVVEVRDMSPTN